MGRKNYTFITEYDIRNNTGYPEIAADNHTSLEYGSYGETDYVVSFFRDILDLQNRRKTAFIMSYNAGIAPHDKIQYLRDEIFNETADFVINSEQPEYNTGLELSPVKYLVVQSLTECFINHMHRTLSNKHCRRYNQTDFEINLLTASRACFDDEGYFIPTAEAMRAVSPLLKKENFYTVYSNLEKTSDFGEFDMPSATDMFKTHTLQAVRDISRIFREYILETGDHVDFRQEKVKSVIRNEASIITGCDLENHISRAALNNYMLNAYDIVSDTKPDKNHPRIDYINIRKQAYYDEYLFAAYRSLDSEANRDNYTTELQNGSRITDFEYVFRERHTDPAFEKLKQFADKELTKRYEIIESAVKSFDIGFTPPKR